ncbi:MAG: tetratricopeptide repeat protein [Chloroflexota bacterium]
MLTLHLTLSNNQVSVRANGKESHQFSLLELSQSEQEWKDFYKNPCVYGGKLFNALFRDAARAEFDALSKQSERTIALVLESSELDSVAWEYAFHGDGYVVEDYPFVRALPEKERPAKRALNEVERVPLLFIPANPLVDLSGEPMQPLKLEAERDEMTRLIKASHAPFDIFEMLPPTPKKLQEVMADSRFREGLIVHFTGHGSVEDGKAFLLFERENGAANPLEAREFVREIKDKAWIGFLSACQSAVPERTEFSNLARELAKAGVPFALGMQFNLPDPFAPNISGQFYNYLAHGHAVPEAARQARRAVKRENEIFVGMIALYAAHPDEAGTLRQAQGAWRGTGAQTVSLFRPADVSDLPSPASGLIGRQRELMRIGTRLLEGKKPLTVTLHGAGGIGKTALLWQTLLRFAPSFELTLAIALDPLPSLESALGRIERFLGLPSPCANDTKQREALVRNALTSKRTLLGLDNFETLNHALNDDATKGTAKSLYAFFKSLPAAGVTLCVTSREKTNLPGEHIEEIYGLEDAMGGALFYENVSTRKDALNEAGLEKLSAAVGGHPLALRLLAPIFEEQAGLSLEQFTEKLQTFLPKASDQWTEQERHESLGTCFAFSMDNFPKTEKGKTLQIALAKLSIFTAFFFDATAAPVLENGFPEKEEQYSEDKARTSSTLHALWERGLLERTEIPLEDGNHYLYRLHPVLNPFAQKLLPENEIESVKENYWKSIDNLARITNDHITKEPVVATIAYRSLPDLVIASESRDDAGAALLQSRVAFFLQWFGHYDDAMRLLEKSRDIYASLNDKKGIAVILHATADILEIRGDLDGAVKLYQQSLKLKEELNDLKSEATTLTAMAGIYITRGDLDSAMEIYRQSLQINEELGDLKGKAIVLGEMGSIYARRGNFDKALEMYMQKLEISQKLGERREMSVVMHNVANIYVDRGNFDEAMKLCQMSLEIDESLHDLKSKSSSLYQMANICFRWGDLDKALEYYKQSLKIKEQIGDLGGKAIALNGMANIYFQRNDLDGALNLYQEAFNIVDGLGDLENQSAILHGMATIYFGRGDLEQAVKLYQRALRVAEKIGDLHGKSMTLGMMGQALWRFNHFSESLQALLDSLETSISIGARPDTEMTVRIITYFPPPVRWGLGAR